MLLNILLYFFFTKLTPGQIIIHLKILLEFVPIIYSNHIAYLKPMIIYYGLPTLNQRIILMLMYVCR